MTEYAREVRERAEGSAVYSVQKVEKDGEAESKKGGLSRLLKLGACCAAPILALVILVPLLQGRATGLAAIGGNLLYFAALLACPLMMYFMMRNMHRMQHGDEGEGDEKTRDRKALPSEPEKP